MSEYVKPEINNYLLAHSTPVDEILTDLATETNQNHASAAGMQVSADEGQLLTMLVRLIGARNAVEVGVFTGFSSICIARGLADGGRLLACDVSEEWTGVAARYWERAGVQDRIDLKIAPAIETLRALPTDPVIDFAFIDADKRSYQGYYEELVPRLRPGGLIVLDNVLFHGRIFDQENTNPDVEGIRIINEIVVADERVDAVMTPIRDGVTLIRKR